MNSQRLTLAPGDLIVQQDANGVWHAVKILNLDAFPDGALVAHCLTYNDAACKPDLDSVGGLGVFVGHAPIAADCFEEGWERIGNQPASKEDLDGYVGYLRLTDFSRYAAFTGQDVGEIVRQANQHYRRACGLGDEGRRAEAITEYDHAVDLFPLFYEAIDNRAFLRMELGQYQEALADFELSLEVNCNGVTAFFSKGECLLRIGDLSAAELIFDEGISRFPEQGADFEKYRGIARTMQARG